MSADRPARPPKGASLPYAVSSYPDVQSEHVTYYHGSTKFYSPSPGGGAYEHHAVCEHRHTDYEQARRCGARLAKATVKAKNAEALPGLLAAICDYVISDGYSDGAEKWWQKLCRGHTTSESHLYRTEAEAAASDWTCPWGVSA